MTYVTNNLSQDNGPRSPKLLPDFQKHFLCHKLIISEHVESNIIFALKTHPSTPNQKKELFLKRIKFWDKGEVHVKEFISSLIYTYFI